MEEAVKKVLTENVWSLATFDQEPNVVPMGFKTVTADGILLIGDVMMETTVKNVLATGKASVSAFDPKTSAGYQVKGSARYITEGPVMDQMNQLAAAIFHGAAAPKGVIALTPEKVIVTTPGPDNKKELPL